MANQQETTKFYGGIVKRVLILYPKSTVYRPNYSRLLFIRDDFNSKRNYREFSGKYPVEILEASSCSLPNINDFQEGDACLLIGSGRYIDKRQFEFAKKCFANNIPVFFIRKNSADYDVRTTDPIWRSNSVVINLENNRKCHLAPENYFMQIPSAADFLFSGWNNDLYMMFPAMVPTN